MDRAGRRCACHFLVHSILTSPEFWRKVMPLLPGTHGLAWEMVGYGQSIEESRSFDLAVGHEAEYLAAWMRPLGIGKAVLVGHDPGGRVVQSSTASGSGGLLLTNAIACSSWPMPFRMFAREQPTMNL